MCTPVFVVLTFVKIQWQFIQAIWKYLNEYLLLHICSPRYLIWKFCSVCKVYIYKKNCNCNSTTLVPLFVIVNEGGSILSYLLTNNVTKCCFIIRFRIRIIIHAHIFATKNTCMKVVHFLSDVLVNKQVLKVILF